MPHGALALLLAALGVAFGFSPTLSPRGLRHVQQSQLPLVASLAPVAEQVAVAEPVPAAVQLQPMRSETAPSESPLVDHFVELFAGHFDNIAQVRSASPPPVPASRLRGTEPSPALIAHSCTDRPASLPRR